MSSFPSRRARLAMMGVILVAACAFRLVGLFDPLGTRTGAPWREADVGAMTRSFAEESYNPLYPRIAWRGDGPGYVESELPLVPLIAAPFERVGTDLDLTVRTTTALVSIVSFLLVALVAWRTLSPAGAVAASALFAVSPIPVYLGSAGQPDPFMVVFLVLAFFFLLRFTLEDRTRDLLFASAAVGAAILAKATAAHMGLLFAGVVLWRHGRRAAITPRVWAAAILAIAPGALWYRWVHQFWTEYGNSLGISNEYHWVGLDLLRSPHFLRSILRRELVEVFSIPGALLGLFAAERVARRLRLRRTPHLPPSITKASVLTILAIGWVASALAMYIAAGRTTADEWAFYYHAASAPAAALLAGAGFAFVDRASPDGRYWNRFGIGAAIGAGLVAVVVALQSTVDARLVFVGIFLLLTAVATGLVRPTAYLEPSLSRLSTCIIPGLAVVLLASAVTAQGRQAVLRKSHRDVLGRLGEERACVQELAPHVPKDALIVVRGSKKVDATGRPVAHAESMLFYWMDRDGFVLADEDVSLPELARVADQGGRYYVASHERLVHQPDLEAAIRARYPAVASCSTHTLYDLDAPAQLAR